MGSKKYQEVIEYIHTQIAKNRWLAGEKVPSIRALSMELSVSRNTIIRAYQELEAARTLYAAPRSGYRVREETRSNAPSQVDAPGYVDLLETTKKFLETPLANHQMPAGCAHPDTDFPAIKTLYAEIGRQSRYQAHIPSHYQLPPGNHKLVTQLRSLCLDNGIECNERDILVTHGAQQAISLSLQALTSPGDIVAVESPCYFGNLLLMESLDLKVIEIPSCPVTGIDIDAVEQALQKWQIKALLVTPNYSNPTNSVMPMEARQRLLDVSGELPIIEDDVFGELYFDARLPSLAALDTRGRVVYCSSLSKTLDSRLRLGWLVAGRYRSVIEKRLLSDNMGSLNLIQTAVGEFLSTGKYRQHLMKIRRNYAKKQKQFVTWLRESLDEQPALKDLYSMNVSNGNYLCWIEFPEGMDSDLLYEQCSKEKISIFPGSVFATGDQFKQCVRLSFSRFAPTRHWQKGLRRFAELAATHYAGKATKGKQAPH
ncbi:putative Bacterial regulatory protein GntR [Vibrio nigripulchritudo MADA3029]|uniref:aminotransferase-like domain-containing protein n=1 Tax=Vibrio nigripulchritudo TaxID=28173 RepID=UPI0003B1F7D2|nr:PLP-dependent aminotransferase family protein [Vibrio nigripulchritudo]CCN49532.1 putative Bacterial regulatory protein GntR [Vibrio nigripulchritudo MADA3020]CCN51369.1 putative Bacterial regulatory protein GntR [Vibrio nigripulchritudo MADA3021]CCN60004.1 putative Bacterial regulatory protein GntR [Vibrio nigripulchritudo MADA3029]